MENEDKLKNSLNSLVNKKDNSETPQKIEMSKEEEIGFHKGSLNTLSAERNELVKMVGNVEAIMQAHIKRLQEMGVDLGKK